MCWCDFYFSFQKSKPHVNRTYRFQDRSKNTERCYFGTTYKMATSGAYNFGPEVATGKRFRILVVLDEYY